MGSSASKTSSSSCCSASNSPPVTKHNSKFPSLSSPATVPRAFSFPMLPVHHPPAKKGDTHHLVSLTSTTYGSLQITDLEGPSDRQTFPHMSVSGKNNKKTHEPEGSRDSLSPDSVINTWELMNDLEDDYLDNCNDSVMSFSELTADHDVGVNGSALKPDDSYEFVRMEEDEEDWIPLPSKPKQPLWKHLAEESFLSDLDPNIISSYKRALSSRQLEQEKPRLSETEGDKKKIVLYFTSLRGIRKTYEDCCCVRSVLRGYQVKVEERDISMDSKYRKELQIALGEEKPVCLPQVFIRGVHIGGMEEVKKLNDGGELGEILKGFPVCDFVGACGCCGDARFVPCTSCGGSTKVFEEQEDAFKRCNICNENGLVRCKKCCLW
ncbi:uncharacterized protein At5g39865-like isoform X2 [Raphanus sativus]|uniref:Uncharacterized protein At5g39865-like isoform X2 n=1 Tax=Raphanus sativus TaxID=3726 RepID=A0A9W3DD19_RAPSA|nr:uncharacterized protein At5g39865-like isoform X2 [Raphanus sativus]XP_056861775.1 uncharacterized protein At5g39865-like isoform X2 [Raphanus sativus]